MIGAPSRLPFHSVSTSVSTASRWGTGARMYCLRLLGGASIDAGSGPLGGPVAQRRRLALLALLAVSPAVSRERVAALLFPEDDAERARHGLSNALHAIRKVLGREAIVAVGDELRLDPALVTSDVAAFERALAAGEHERAGVLYGGPFLDGFAVPDAAEFERWVEDVRQRLAQQYARALEAAAEARERSADARGAVEWWQRLALHDPYSSRVALRLCDALAASGDAAGALHHAQRHAERLREDLSVEPGPEVRGLVERLGAAEDAARPRPETRRAPKSPRAALSPLSASPAPPPTEMQPVAPRPPRVATRGRVAAASVIAGVALASLALFGEQLRGRGAPAHAAAVRPPRADPVARDLYERGRHAWAKRTPDGLDAAVAWFRAAIERNPADARAFAGLADAYVMLGYLGYRPAAAMFPKGKAAALRALALDSSAEDAYAPLGQAHMWERKWEDAEWAFREAIRRDPRNATAHQWYATMLVPLGRVDEALAHLARASELEPLSLQINNMRGMVLHYAGRTDESLRHYRRFVDEEPDTAWVRQNPWLLSNMSRVLAARGQYGEALRAVQRALPAAPRHPRLLCDLATIYAAMGQPARALDAFAAADTANGQYAFFRAELFGALHQPDSAFHWLDRVREWGPSPMGELRADPRLASIRPDPRYPRLLARLGLIAHRPPDPPARRMHRSGTTPAAAPPAP